MGEVYGALDTRLERTVAIKILPSISPPAKGQELQRKRGDRVDPPLAILNPGAAGIPGSGRSAGTVDGWANGARGGWL